MTNTVNLGVDSRLLGISRDDFEVIQEQLMKVGLGKSRDFRMVEFESAQYNIDEFTKTLCKRDGQMTWVVGHRGSGKTEAIANLFRRQIEREGKSTIPRLPLYISVSSMGEGRRDTSARLNMAFVNQQILTSLRQAFQFLIRLEGKEEYYKDLRRLLKERQDVIMHDLETFTYRPKEGGIMREELDLALLMKKLFPNISGKNNAPFRVTLYIDDADKISGQELRDFLREAQTDLQTLTAAGVVVVMAIKKKFRRSVRGDDGVDWCGLANPMPGGYPPHLHLTLPELNELQAADIHNLIKKRICYLRFSEGSWSADFKKNPYKSPDRVIESKDWDSYDIREMRRNGAILTLSSWLSYRGHTAIRYVLRNIEMVINKCDSRPGTQLDSRILEQKLRSLDQEETDLLIEELAGRLSGIPKDRMVKELELLNEEAWQNALEICQQAITYGEWTSKHLQTLKLGIKSGDDGNSAIMKFLNLVFDMSDDEKKVLPKVLARTPDDIFSLFTYRQMAIMIENEMTKAGSREMAKRFVETPILEPSTSEGIIGSAFKKLKPLISDDMTATERRDLTAELSVEIVNGLIVAERLKNSKRKTKLLRDRGAIRRARSEDSHRFDRFLLNYVAIRSEHGNQKHESLLHDLQEALLGNDPLRLLSDQDLWDEAFSEIVAGEPIGIFNSRDFEGPLEEPEDEPLLRHSEPVALICETTKEQKLTSNIFTLKAIEKGLIIEEEITFRIKIDPINHANIEDKFWEENPPFTTPFHPHIEIQALNQLKLLDLMLSERHPDLLKTGTGTRNTILAPSTSLKVRVIVDAELTQEQIGNMVGYTTIIDPGGGMNSASTWSFEKHWEDLPETWEGREPLLRVPQHARSVSQKGIVKESFELLLNIKWADSLIIRSENTLANPNISLSQQDYSYQKEEEEDAL
jgi:hypothetical protein